MNHATYEKIINYVKNKNIKFDYFNSRNILQIMIEINGKIKFE
jgi:hypothetical protein